MGSTGMIGQGVLKESLKSDDISKVLVINRRSCGLTHPKLHEIIHPDFIDFSSLDPELGGYDACMFCLGISSVGMKEPEYHKITYTITLEFATVLARLNPQLRFCFISGAGTDSSESGRSMWARVKGKTENALLKLPFAEAYMFRPAFIQPLDNIKSKTALYKAFYTVLKPLYFILKPFKSVATNTRLLGKAMIRVARDGFDRPSIESRDINTIGS
jgi:uncharacterized protein YbjT (DUF2867 family)